MTNDWRYSKERMELRAKSLEILGKAFTLKREVYEFCDMWISQGGKNVNNIVNEFMKYMEDVATLAINEKETCEKSRKENNRNGD